MTAVAFLAATLGGQLARAGQILQRQEAATLDLAALNDDIIRCLSSGLLTVDRQGRVLTINEAAGEILGLEPSAATGRPIRDLVPELQPMLAKLEDASTVRRGEILARRAQGERALGVSISPLTNHLGEPLGRIVNFQDLTELRRMEEQVKRGERLAAIGGLAAGIAHEIRNPLASISGSIELLRSAPQVEAENRALMEIVLREVDRLNTLVTELIDYAKPRAPLPVSIDANAAIKETVRVFAQDRSGPPVSVRFEELAGKAPTVHADPAQLRQVIWNLLRNAAESMPDGGEVVVTLGSDDDWCTIGVRDHGVGIPREDQDRIFEPFYTTKARGSGLGLAIIHRIVSAHGGVISLSSAVGEGTTVTVRLPTAR
jgi:two-component system sensor histidine kinase PilS (NtrC family)